MHRLYALQQRLAITSAEAATLTLFFGLMLAGWTVRYAHSQAVPPFDYAALDATFDERSAASRAGETAPNEEHVASAGPTASVADEGRVVGEGYAAKEERVRPAAPGALTPGSIDLNTAPPRALEALPGVGPAIAARIVDYRERHGGFREPAEITAVRGIGPKTYEKLAPFIAAGGTVATNGGR